MRQLAQSDVAALETAHELRGLSFDGLSLVGCDFTDRIIEECSFRDCVLTGSRFNASTVRACEFAQAGMAGVSLFAATFEECKMMGLQQIDEAKQTQELESNYNWVIYVKDSSDVPGAPVKQTITVNLKASNTSGSMCGEYKGSATAKTTNEGSVGAGELKATASSKSSGLTFNMGPGLTALTPADPGLPPLTKGGPDFVGSGTISMSTAGTAKVTGKGATVSGGFSNDSTLPIEVYVMGPLVRLAVVFPQGTMYLDGYMLGEGKKK